MQPPVVLVIGAHDPLGGAGLAADITTIAAHGHHGVSAVTAVTAQRFDTVEQVAWTDPQLVVAQIDAIIGEVPIAAVKTGLLGQTVLIDALAERVAAGALPKPVVDPVLVDGGGRPLVSGEVETAYRERLFPLAAVITPNLAEARLLVHRAMSDTEAVIDAAPDLRRLGAGTVIVTGGASDDLGADVVIDELTVEVLCSEAVDTLNVRGSGCTFATAVACGLASADSVPDAARSAHHFVRRQLLDAADWQLAGPGRRGPVSHRCLD